MAVSESQLEKRHLLTEMLSLTQRAAGPLTAAELLDLLAERARLMERVAAIDARCAGGAPPADPEAQHALTELVALNAGLLTDAVTQRDALLRQLLGGQTLPRR